MPVDENDPLAGRQVVDLIEAVASDEISPGAGSAGAIALGLAAACARKAVAITRKRRPEDGDLLPFEERLTEIGRLALAGADEDARRFEDFVQSKDAAAASRLVKTGETLQQLARSFGEVLRSLEPRIDPVVAGDLTAAYALLAAFRTIQGDNLEENRQAAASLGARDVPP